jgi:hypothetical protein
MTTEAVGGPVVGVAVRDDGPGAGGRTSEVSSAVRFDESSPAAASVAQVLMLFRKSYPTIS